MQKIKTKIVAKNVGANCVRPNFEGKTQKGITLIALVITIIVMLILVGITISVSLNGGLFTTAKEATDETQIAQEKEQLLMAALSTLNENGKVDIGKLDSSLPEGFTGSNGEYASKTGNVFKVSENGSITLEGERGEEEPDTPVTPPATPTISLNPKTITGEIESGTTEEIGTITATVSNVTGNLQWNITPTNSGLELIDTDNANVKKIKASKAVENATITVSYGTTSDTCSVTVTEKEVIQGEQLAGTWVFNSKIVPISTVSSSYYLDYTVIGWTRCDRIDFDIDDDFGCWSMCFMYYDDDEGWVGDINYGEGPIMATQRMVV